MLLSESDTAALKKEQQSLERELVVISEMMQKSFSVPVFSTGGDSDYDELADRYQRIQQKVQEISSMIKRKKQQATAIKRFCRLMKESDEVITEFDIEQFLILVDHMTVYGKGDVRVTFRDGTVL